jgi:putative sterol carrier protein
MTNAQEMASALEGFAAQFNRSPELPQMTRGWDRTILIRARDAGWTLALRVEGGRVRLLPASPPAADIVLEGPSDTLAAIFRGEISPTEPYLDGTLVVRSSEADMMKLDVFTLMVWGE